jgi:hypothetical protein
MLNPFNMGLYKKLYKYISTDHGQATGKLYHLRLRVNGEAHPFL